MPAMLPTALLANSPTPSCPSRHPTARGMAANASDDASMSASPVPLTCAADSWKTASPTPTVHSHTPTVTRQRRCTHLQPVLQRGHGRHEVAPAQVGAVERAHEHPDAHDDGGEQRVGAPAEVEHEALRACVGAAPFHGLHLRRCAHCLRGGLCDGGLGSMGEQPGISVRQVQVFVDFLIHQAALEGIVAVHRLQSRRLFVASCGVHQCLAEAGWHDEHVGALSLGNRVLQGGAGVFDRRFDATCPQVGGKLLREVAAVAVDDGKRRFIRHECGGVASAK